MLKKNRKKWKQNCHAASAAKSFQSCPTLCNPIDGSPPGSQIPGILQARTLEWVAISFSKNCHWTQRSHCWAYTLRKPELKQTCTPLFIAALFTIARTWKQPRCPSADKWIRKLWYIYTVEYYSAVKKNAFESVLMRWMKLEPIIQKEVSQKEKHQQSILTHIYGIQKDGNDDPICKTAKRHRYKEQTFGLCGRRRGWEDLREQH